MGECMRYGAVIERGVVKERADGGIVVKSEDRPGIESGPIQGIDGGLYVAGDRVWFFLTKDGDGAIIGVRS